MNSFELWVCILIVGLAFCIGALYGYVDGRGDTRAEAAKHGAAEYVVGYNGRSEFQWKVPANE